MGLRPAKVHEKPSGWEQCHRSLTFRARHASPLRRCGVGAGHARPGTLESGFQSRTRLAFSSLPTQTTKNDRLRHDFATAATTIWPQFWDWPPAPYLTPMRTACVIRRPPTSSGSLYSGSDKFHKAAKARVQGLAFRTTWSVGVRRPVAGSASQLTTVSACSLAA